MQTVRGHQEMDSPEGRAAFGGTPGMGGVNVSPPITRLQQSTGGYNITMDGSVPSSVRVQQLQDFFSQMGGNMNVNFSDNSRDLTSADINGILERSI
jgi:hypothetical protein